jgi:hypothetical protein
MTERGCAWSLQWNGVNRLHGKSPTAGARAVTTIGQGRVRFGFNTPPRCGSRTGPVDIICEGTLQLLVVGNASSPRRVPTDMQFCPWGQRLGPVNRNRTREVGKSAKQSPGRSSESDSSACGLQQYVRSDTFALTRLSLYSIMKSLE